MCESLVKQKNTIIIFSPFHPRNVERCYLLGDFKLFDDFVKLFFIKSFIESCRPKECINVFNERKLIKKEASLKLQDDWIYSENVKDKVVLKKLKINGETKDLICDNVIWIYYDFRLFSQCEVLSRESCGAYSEKSYFTYFKEKINEEKTNEEQKRHSQLSNFTFKLLLMLSTIIIKLSEFSSKLLPVTKYFNVALHIDNSLNGFVWAVKSVQEKKKLDIKVINLLLSVLLDMLLGTLFLNWLNSKVSLDSFPSLFLLTAESIVNSLKDLITWLRGDPAGLKLNWAFNRVLATFFLFHIDIWWTFIAFLEPLVRIVFQIFLKLGLLGVTYQASITADLLALVSFHVYCIYAYAAKLYSIQTSSLISLWRLFLGLKRNPLRGKVDSCRYSPEQLFVGTLGFTVLLFLLPTTLLYYIVFTCIRLSVLTLQAVLLLLRLFNQILPVYSTILWLFKSPKIASGIELVPHKEFLSHNFILMKVNPVAYSWWVTVNYFMPDCAPKPSKIDLPNLISSILSGKRIYPI